MYSYERLTQGHNGFAVLSVQDLTHSAVDSGQTAEDALEAGDHGDGVVTGEVTQSQQHKQHSQAAENNLSSLLCFRVPMNMNAVKTPHSNR